MVSTNASPPVEVLVNYLTRHHRVMKEFHFKIPELSGLPPERRESLLRRCLDSDEFSRRIRKIRLVCFLSAMIGAIASINVFMWSGLVQNSVLVGFTAVGTVAFFIALMIFGKIWFQVRLVRTLVRKEIGDA